MILLPAVKGLNRRTIAVAAVNAALLAALVGVLAWPLPDERQPIDVGTSAAPAPSARNAFPADTPPLFGRVVAVAAPRNSPQPARPAALPQAAPAPQPFQWRVTGIVIPANSRAMTLLERRESPHQVIRAVVGTKLEDWIVESIAPRSVSFRRGETLLEVALDPRP